MMVHRGHSRKQKGAVYFRFTSFREGALARSNLLVYAGRLLRLQSQSRNDIKLNLRSSVLVRVRLGISIKTLARFPPQMPGIYHLP